VLFGLPPAAGTAQISRSDILDADGPPVRRRERKFRFTRSKSGSGRLRAATVSPQNLSRLISDVERAESDSLQGLGITRIYFRPTIDIRAGRTAAKSGECPHFLGPHFLATHKVTATGGAGGAATWHKPATH